jgi:alkylation response protein AidB-like acyl-CoA dehydrogenase
MKICQWVTSERIQIYGGPRSCEDPADERSCGDSERLTVGEGTYETQCLVMARRFLEQDKI